jgi:quinoprotein glucose dehydrogenase
VWSIPSADPERDLVFVPTSSPSPDFYGGERKGDNLYADSVVALRASSGELVWYFQTVHHDLWDYDLASQPVLLDFPQADGRLVPAVAQATKMGHVFFLDRETGKPLIPVEERRVPPSTVPGERAAETQPFPSWPPSLAPQQVDRDTVFGFTPWDRARCRQRLAELRNEGVFTPPSLEGTLLYPGTAGGSNWGSVAYDPVRRLLVANTSNIAQTVQLVPHEQADALAAARSGRRFSGFAQMAGTPYSAVTGVFVSPWTVPCVRPPWGHLTALDLAGRSFAWRRSLGTTRDLAPVPIALELGTPNQGGPILTAGGMLFIAAALDDVLRGFDSETGELAWSARLPAGAQATPMTYRARPGGRQFVVVAAGGHAQLGTTRGDFVLAFALPASPEGR